MRLHVGQRLDHEAVVFAFDEAAERTVVTVIIDKRMRIRKVGSTYNAEHENNLELVQDLLSH